MLNITLPDGKKLSFSDSTTGFEIAEKISKSLSKQALVVSVDGQLRDLDFKIQKDCKISMIMIDLWDLGGTLLGTWAVDTP